ncbi:putative LRR receptor-like serine/threonine-protein kinase [Glycine soja]|uniref:Putative LRR receptor-like serine/threonine-protein kinase n=1 Tax=Glycine soja TaxID=3848 RepID=A0A445H056_GLYSO|nr:putative LRR receptor-like serine/threonine-protein kinase [Glycine soja]
MQNIRDSAVFLRRLVSFAILIFFIVDCTRGESSESESFFNFIRALDPKNVLNITWIESPSHPCLVKLNGKSAKFSAEREVVKDHRRVSPITKATTHEVQEVKLKEGDSELVFFVEDRESQKIEEFVETLKKISNLKHQNILPLVGYRSTSEEKLIIYEYQSNGSLLNLLNDYIAGRKDFPWKMRLNIACGIARGLAFIYRKLDGEEVMSHGNLKPSNILLDENNEPLISEHGLSKFMNPNRGKSIEVSRIELARWVRSMVREEWTGEVFDKEVRENDHQWAFPLLNIALLCVSRFQENRPTTMEILEKIEEVMDQHHERCASKCCSIGSNHDECCSLHKIIPETWDSPGSNY